MLLLALGTSARFECLFYLKEEGLAVGVFIHEVEKLGLFWARPLDQVEKGPRCWEMVLRVGVASVALTGRTDEALEELVVRRRGAVYQEREEGSFHYQSNFFT